MMESGNFSEIIGFFVLLRLVALNFQKTPSALQMIFIDDYIFIT